MKKYIIISWEGVAWPPNNEASDLDNSQVLGYAKASSPKEAIDIVFTHYGWEKYGFDKYSCVARRLHDEEDICGCQGEA